MTRTFDPAGGQLPYVLVDRKGRFWWRFLFQGAQRLLIFPLQRDSGSSLTGLKTWYSSVGPHNDSNFFIINLIYFYDISLIFTSTSSLLR